MELLTWGECWIGCFQKAGAVVDSYRCDDCAKVIEENEGHYNYPVVRCQTCGDRLMNSGLKHLGEQL